MARILKPEQFRQSTRGTVFAYGQPYCFGNMLILDSVIQPSHGSWGFYATDPMWVDSDERESFAMIDAMLKDGASFPSDTASTKYMSYDGNPMDIFLVLERADWDRLTAMTNFAP